RPPRAMVLRDECPEVGARGGKHYGDAFIAAPSFSSGKHLQLFGESPAPGDCVAKGLSESNGVSVADRSEMGIYVPCGSGYGAVLWRDGGIVGPVRLVP